MKDLEWLRTPRRECRGVTAVYCRQPSLGSFAGWFCCPAAQRKGLAKVGHSGFHAVCATWISQYKWWDLGYPACFRYKLLICWHVLITTEEPYSFEPVTSKNFQFSTKPTSAAKKKDVKHFNPCKLNTSLCLYVQIRKSKSCSQLLSGWSYR